MLLIKNCSVTGIFDKSMEHVGTKQIVPYQQYVPLLEGFLLEVLLYQINMHYFVVGLSTLPILIPSVFVFSQNV